MLLLARQVLSRGTTFGDMGDYEWDMCLWFCMRVDEAGISLVVYELNAHKLHNVHLHTYYNLHVKLIVSGRVGRVFVAQIRDVARRDPVHGDVLQIPL